MSSASDGAGATLYCPLCGTDRLCDECTAICVAILGETSREAEGTVPTFSKSLEQTLDRALSIARQRRDPHAVEEHLLLALIDDPDAAAVMRGCQVDLDAARLRIEAALAERAQSPLAEGADSTPSSDFQRIIQRAVIHVQSAKGDGGVTGADVLVAALADPPAAELLQQLGLTRYAATVYITQDLARAGAELAADAPPGSLVEVRLLNDDYTPMEFVVEVLERIFDQDRETATRLMLHIHHQGFGRCGVYSHEAAVAKVAEVLAFARMHQHPLQCFLLPNASA